MDSLSVKNMFHMFLHTLTDLYGHIKETEELHGDFLNPSICDFGCLHSIILHYSNAVPDIKVIIVCFWPAFNLYFTGFSVCCSFIWHCRWKVFFYKTSVAFFL